jgi:hypothetical protein
MLNNEIVAYIGPGAGIGVIGALVGVIAALGSSLFFVLLWPIRQMLKKKAKAAATTSPHVPPRGQQKVPHHAEPASAPGLAAEELQ